MNLPACLTPQALGEFYATACMDKAERQGFDTQAAAAFILRELRKNGDTPGEALTDLAQAAGHVVHDQRAFGGVFRMLSKRGLIRCVGYCARRKGHSTSGGRVWRAS